MEKVDNNKSSVNSSQLATKDVQTRNPQLATMSLILCDLALLRELNNQLNRKKMQILDIYNQYPIQLVKGENLTLWDDKGNEYVDFYSGHGVISLGHGNVNFKKAITEQLGQLAFYTNAFVNPLQKEVACLLGELSGYKNYNLFLSNSGAEANENAFKIASFFTKRKKILALKGAFHGRSAGAVAATDIKNIKPEFGSEIQVDFVDINDIDSLKDLIGTREYAAFIIEGIQGVSGVWEASASFWNAARLMCTQTGTLLIADEVQSGYARTGKFFAHQFCSVYADIITVAKGMGNGFPVAGTIISPNIKLAKGMLGTTYGGGQLACAAAISVLQTIKDDALQKNALIQGEFLISELQKIDGVKCVRGRGLMLGIEFDVSAKKVRQRLMDEHGIITGFSGTDILRILPPLSMPQSKATLLINALKLCIVNIKQEELVLSLEPTLV